MRIAVQSSPFDFGTEAAAFSESVEGAGAVVTFAGIVRDVKGGLIAMDIEHYPGMTEAAIRSIAEDACERWDLADLLILHRHGSLMPGEHIMMVATAARHRAAAFDSAQYLMDYLKSRAPFWKKEITRDGASWVAARDEDEDALSRW